MLEDVTLFDFTSGLLLGVEHGPETIPGPRLSEPATGESGRVFVCMGLEGALGRRVTVGLLLALWYCRRAVPRTQASRRSSVS